MIISHSPPGCLSPCWMSFQRTQNLELSSNVTKQLCLGGLTCPPIITQELHKPIREPFISACVCVGGGYPLDLAQVVEAI